MSTAFEGAARRVGGERIVAAVRAQATALETARKALGPASEAELVAGASALRAGLAPDSLARLRTARSGSTVVPLVVIADMIARGVPAATASTEVIAAARAGTRDEDFLRLRDHVAREIRSGASPGEAARAQSKAMMLEIAARSRAAPPAVRPRPGGDRP
jgi:hypothetical protein